MKMDGRSEMNNWSGVFLVAMMVATGFAFARPVEAAPDAEFGRLFSTAQERSRLDNLRQQRTLQTARQQDASPTAPTSAEPPPPITLQGYVKRSDGAATVWINNQPVQENSALEQLEIGRLSKSRHSSKDYSESLAVRIPATGKNLHLKAGQIYEPENDRILELKLLEKEKQLELKETGENGSSYAE